MSDLIKRLRDPVMLHSNPEQTNAERREAADMIASQLAVICDLANALEDAVDTLEAMDLHIDNRLYDRLRATLEAHTAGQRPADPHSPGSQRGKT